MEQGREIMPKKKDEKPYMDNYIYFCKLISMWPRTSENIIRYWFVFLFCLITNSLMLGGMYARILFNTGDLDGAAEVIDFATVFTSGMFRYIYVFFRGRKYLEMVDFLEGTFIRSSFPPGDKLTMDKQVRVAKYVCYSYYTITILWIFQITTSPFMIYAFNHIMGNNVGGKVDSSEIKMYLEVSMPFNKSVHPFTEISQAIHVFGYFTMDFIYIFTDGFWFAMMILTTGQFELISHSLRQIAEDSNGDDPDPAEMVRVLDSCIRQHVLAREIVSKIEDLMHPIVLVDFLHAVASISFILLELTIAIYQSEWVHIINMVAYLFVSIFHMYTLDYFGNELTLKEQEISTALYELPWYKYPKEMRNKIAIVTTMARNPRRLTGGKLYTVSLEFFAGTIRTIFSYFMVLLQLREASIISNKYK